jgi:hypothetical protein
LFNANSTIFQLYHDENKLIFNEMIVRLVLDQHAELNFYSASSLKQQSAGRHVAPLEHIILIPSQPIFALSPARHDIAEILLKVALNTKNQSIIHGGTLQQI